MTAANNDDFGLALGEGQPMSEQALDNVASSTSAFSQEPAFQPKPLAPERRGALIDEAASRMAGKSEAERNQAYLAEARTLHDDSQQAYREAVAKGDNVGMERALRHIGVASQRMADEEFRTENDRMGVKRTMTPDVGRRLDAAIAEQKKIVDYHDDLVTKGTEDPSFIPAGQSLDQWKSNLQAEKKALNQLEVGRESGRQMAAVDDPSFLGETGRSLLTGMFGTGAEMFGGAIKQAGATANSPAIGEIGEATRAFGKGVRQDTPAQSSPEVLALGEKGAFFTELKNYVGAKLGEGLGTSVPIIAAAIAAGPAAGFGAGMAMGIGQMRNSLEEEFAAEGIDFPEEKAAFYVYTYGTAIGALESATEVLGISRLTGEPKKMAMRNLARAIAKGAAHGAVMEGVTEALQEIVEIVGVSQATGKPIDWAKAGTRMIEAGAAGAVPGVAFGTVSEAGERRNALKAALEKADSLGFRAPATDSRSETEKNNRPVSDQGKPTETVRDLSPSIDSEMPSTRKPGVRSAQPDPVIDEARAVIDGVTPPDAMRDAADGKTVADQGASAPSVTQAGAERDAAPVIPTFAQVMEALPKDEAGDPDIGALMGQVAEFGAKTWNGLNAEQKAAVYERFKPVVEQAAPAIKRIAEAVQSGEAAQVVSQVADAVFTPERLAQMRADAQGSPAALRSVDRIELEQAHRAKVAAERPASGQAASERPTLPPPTKPAPAARAPRSQAEIRAAFDKVLASKTKRADWASTIGVDNAQLNTLVSEALADGRLKKDKRGGIVRTAKAKEAAKAAAVAAAPAGQTQATTVDRPTEVRANAAKSDLARRYALELAEAANTDAVAETIDRLKTEKKGTNAALAEIVKILTGRTGKAKTKASSYAEIESAAAKRIAKRPRKTGVQNAITQAFRDDARPVPEGSVPEAVPGDGEVGPAAGAPVADGRGRDGDVAGSGSPDDQLAGSAGELSGEGEGAGTDSGSGAGVGELGANPPAAAASLTDDQKAAVAAQVQSDIERHEKARADRETLNYRITDADQIGKGGPKAKVRGNIEAIRTLRRLQEEKRPATPDEKAKLVKYVGWGMFSQDVFADHKPEWKAERDAIKDLLTPDEYKAARASTINAHYTSPDVINAMWDALKHMGFKGGRVLEPSAGIGHFIGLTPPELRADTAWTAVELDILSGDITKALYGATDVRVAGFETQKWPDNHFDLAISNVPFAKEGPYDPTYKDQFTLHDYFFVKALDKVRPGGIVAFITSAGTLDKVGGVARREMEKRGTFLGAVRLPGGNQGAFKANAGTDVTTDIVFMRKKIVGEPALNPEWTSRVEIKTPDKTPQNPTGTTEINGYFAAHPEMMLGKMRLIGSMYGKGEPVLIGPTDGIENKIVNALTDAIPAGAMIPRGMAAADAARTDLDTNTDGIKEGSFYEKDGTLYRKVTGVGEPQNVGADVARKIRGFIGLRNVVNEMLGKQAKGDRRGMDDLREALGKAYDAFVKAHGPINRTIVTTTTRKDGKEITSRRFPVLSLFRDDPDAFKVAAIEVYDEKTDTAKKAAIFNQDIVGSYVPPVVTGPADALAVSLNETGKVDLPLIARRLGVSEPEARAALGDQAFENPAGEIWQTQADYLSGDVVEKLDVARAAAELDPMRYTRNVEALEKVQPEPLTRAEVTVSFGAPWVPIEVYEDFVNETMGTSRVKLSWDDKNARWQVLSGHFPMATNAAWGTGRKNAAEVLSYALNSDVVSITDTVRVPGGGGETVKIRQPDAEAEVRAKVALLKDTFSGNAEAGVDGWAWADMARAERLEKLYNHAYNRIVAQKYDGKHLTFPGLARVVTFPDGGTGTIRLDPHRVNAVWRIIQQGNTLLNHVVGSGKTWTSIMAAMEMKRLGMVQRPMFVVPNHMLNQFATEFYQAYPNAKLLIATKDQMSKDRRREFAAKAASDTWDGIIITHSAFTRVGMQPGAYRDYYQKEVDELVAAMDRAAAVEGKDSPTVKELEKAKKRIETKLQKLVDEESKDEGTTFEELGVDFLFVDEAHLFKSLHFATRHTRVKGIGNKGESKRATDLYVKMQHLEKSRPGRSAVFMTGTPVSNTIAELYTMQRYLQGPMLRKYGVEQFDSWAATFGQIVTKSELSSNSRDFTDTTSFSKFVNMPELMGIVGEVMDTQTADMLKLPRPKLKNGRIDVVESTLSETEEAAITDLIAEMEASKKMKPGEGPPFISLFTKGIQLATDMRLVDPDAAFNPNGKIGKAVGKIHEIWEEGNADPAAPNKAQIVFLDMGVPGSKGRASVVTKKGAAGAPGVTIETDIADAIRKDLMAEARGESEDAAEAEEIDENEVEAKALLVGKFNLYQDIKDKLIAKGIPADQIAFIHDAKNDDQKAKLFEKVRNGDVRILLGSTGKMGVGTNVQRQLIAMHHLDAPWKPAEVEQRDGRILRQGNKNEEVRILRYITKRSFDAYRWQLLDRKSNFIGQMFAGALGVRNAEDIDPPLPEAAELKAAATGNPLIMEHADLTREVRMLEVGERGHFRSQKQAATNAQSSRDYIAAQKNLLAPYEADLAMVQDLSGDKFTVDIRLGGRGAPIAVRERKKAGEALRKYIYDVGSQGWGGYGSSLDLGMLSGFAMTAKVRRTSDGIQVSPELVGTKTYAPMDSFFITETSDPVQLVRRWERLLSGIPEHVTFVKGDIARIEGQLEALDKAAEPKPYPRAAETRRKKARLQRLEAILKPGKGMSPEETKAEEDYVAQGMTNLKATSRTAAGVVDTSASAGKAAQMAEGLTGEGAASAAINNFQGVLRSVYRQREQLSLLRPDQLAKAVDQIALDVNNGILKEGALYREDDSPKYPYTSVADIPVAYKQFFEEFAQRLDDENADPVETAAWIEWRVNLTDHFYADGVGKTSKALAAIPLMRAGLPLPKYRSNKEFFQYSQRNRVNPNEGGQAYLGPDWERFLAYYRTLMYDPVLDAPNFGLPKPPETLPEGHPLLQSHDTDMSPERVALRERLIEQRFAGKTAVPAGEQPIVYVLGGGSAAGKGAVLAQLRKRGIVTDNFVELDPDSFKTGDPEKGWGGIPEFWEIDAAGDSRGAGVTHEESSITYKAAQKRGMEGRYNLVLDQTLGNPAKGEALLQSLKDAGYLVRLVGVTVDPEVAIKRAVARAQEQRRYVPLSALLTAHKGFSNGFEAYAKVADSVRLFNTAVLLGESPIKVAVKDANGDLEVVEKNAYIDFARKGGLNEKATTIRQLRSIEGAPGRLGESLGRGNPGGVGTSGRGGQEAPRTAGSEDPAGLPGQRLNGNEGRVTPALPDSEAQKAVDAFIARKEGSGPLYALGGLVPSREERRLRNYRGTGTKTQSDLPGRISSLWRKPPVAGTFQLFHATNADFQRFDAGMSSDFGVHFGTAEQAGARMEQTRRRTGSRTIPVEVSVSNAITLPDLGYWGPREVSKALQAAGYEVTTEEQMAFVQNAIDITEAELDIAKIGDAARPRLRAAVQAANRAIGAKLDALGVDGIWYRNDIEGAGWSLLVWKEGQVVNTLTGDRMMALDGDISSVLSEDKARRATLTALKMGRTVSLSASAQDEMRAAMKAMPDILPARSDAGFVAAVRPQKGRPGRYVAEVETADGSLIPISDLTLDDVLGSRALFVPALDGHIIAHFRYASPGKDGVARLTSERWHEAIHSLYADGAFDDATWRLLVDHAESLGILQTKWKSYLELTQDPRAAETDPNHTIAELYLKAYSGRQQNLRDVMEQESVAIMTELLVMGVDLPLPEEIRQVYAMIETGEMARGAGVAGEPRNGALAAIFSPESFERKTLARHFGATRIEDIGPDDPHPGRVLAFHGTGNPIEGDTLDTRGAGRSFGVHFGSIEQGNYFARNRAGPGGTGGNMMPAVLDLQRVVTVRDQGMWYIGDLIRDIEAADPSLVPALAKTKADYQRRFDNGDHDLPSIRQLQDALTAAGVDGLRYMNVNPSEGTGWSYIIWERGHVISATAGTPLFAIGGYKTEPRKGDRNAHIVMRRLADKNGKPFLARVVENGDDITVEMYDDKFPGVSEDKISKGTSRLGSQLGSVDLNYMGVGHFATHGHRGPLYEVGMVSVEEGQRMRGLAKSVYNLIEDMLGTQMMPSGTLLPPGYEHWKRRNPELVRGHQFHRGDEMYYSPKKIKEDLDYAEKRLSDFNIKDEIERELSIRRRSFENTITAFMRVGVSEGTVRHGTRAELVSALEAPSIHPDELGTVGEYWRRLLVEKKIDNLADNILSARGATTDAFDAERWAKNRYDGVREDVKVLRGMWRKVPKDLRTERARGMMFALGGGILGARQPTPPGIAVPVAPAEDEEGSAPALNAVIQKLKDTLNVVPTQTLMGVTIRAEDGTDVLRMNPGRNVRGQMQSATGAVGVRKSRAVDVLAHEMGHNLEVMLGADILDFQQTHAADLEAFSPGATSSEQFADWFSYYVLNGPGARNITKALYDGFEDVIEANSPEMLEGLHEAQDLYQDWLGRSSPEALASDVVSTYSGNSWSEIADGDKSLTETVAGKLSGAYAAVIDDLSPVQQIVKRLLQVADRNGVRDESGRPISLKVAENAYKIARMFRGSHATGYSWLKDGIANRGETTVSFPGLAKALETLFGTTDQKSWDQGMYQAAGNYLIAQRAVAEYDRLEQKANRLADIDGVMERGNLARQKTAAERDRLRGVLDRRETALVRAETMVRDRSAALKAAEAEMRRLQERIQAKKDDVLAAQMARDGAMTSRRQTDLAILERQSTAALRAADAVRDEYETLSTEVALINAEVPQRREQAALAENRVSQIERAVSNLAREREMTAKRGASRPPTRESRDHWLNVIAKTEGDPKFARVQEFARLVHEFGHGMLTLRHQHGFISDELFADLSKRKDWYVPFQRDMSDASAESVFGGGMKKWSPFKKFDGSDRAIINPLETLASDAYATAQQVAFNSAADALASLSERAGPGAASIAHVLTREESVEANAETFDRIRDMALGMGIDAADADRIVHQMEMNFAGEQMSLLQSPATKGPLSLPTIPLYRGGERILVRMTDPEFGVEAFNAISGMGKETASWLTEFFATPARMLQMGVTTHPTFMPRNLFRDIFDAWIKTGALPIVTQVKGARTMKDADFMRRYHEAGGIVGGRNIAALTSREQQVAVMGTPNRLAKMLGKEASTSPFLRSGGLGEGRVSPGSIVLGAVGGGLLGTLYGGPIGGLAGMVAGGYALRRGEVLKAVEAVETITRVGVAAHAYKRAMEHNPNLTETEAMLEAAFVARDVFDWNRRGSKMIGIVRTVTFLNAQIQGIDAAFRKLGGDSDRGMMLSKHLGMVWRRENGGTLSAEEERELGNAYKTWARAGAYSLMLLSLYALATSGDDDDDKKYQDVKDKTKATHSWLPNIFGVDIRLPKAFEWAMPANIIEAIADKIRGRDPRMWDRIVDSTYEIMAPPLVPQAANLIVGLTTNAQLESLAPWMKRLVGHDPENASPRQIVGDQLARLDPESQFDSFTNQLSIDIAKGMAKAGVPRDLIPSPKKIDFILRTGGYWGQDIARGYGIVREAAGGRPREAPRVSDIPVVAGFTGVAARQSKSRDEMFQLMAQSGGQLATAAATYKQLIDEEGTPADAERFLSRLNPEERAYAILKYYGRPSDQKDHPLERLLAVDRTLSKIRKDLILDRLTPVEKQGRKTVRDFEEKITLPPRKQTEVHEIVERLQQAEAWNTMILMGRPGWQGKGEIAVKPIMAELKASSPKVYELFEDRLQATKAHEFADVKADWPELRARILREGANAF